MGKWSTPRSGSLAYLPRGRAASSIGRIRNWPEVREGPKLLAFAGYKAGLTLVYLMDKNPQSPTYGRELAKSATVLDVSPMLVFCLRTYGKGDKGLRSLGEVWMKNPPKHLERVLSVPKKTNADEVLGELEKELSTVKEVRVVLATQPIDGGIGKKKPELMEVKVGGGSAQQQFEYAKGLLGKQVKVSDVFKEGQEVDAIAVTKGKGLQGPVRRWGISLLSHKARKGRRKPGNLGPWHPAHVMRTIPRLGQLGYHQRTEYGKRLLKMGSDGKEVTPKGGFTHYGVVKGDYVVVEGSLPGAKKRLVKLRYSIRLSEEVKPQDKVSVIGMLQWK